MDDKDFGCGFVVGVVATLIVLLIMAMFMVLKSFAVLKEARKG